MISAKHAEALAYAADDIPVFPCAVDGKRPVTANGFRDATTDVEQINAWWEEADYNVALCPNDAGWGVVDVDPSGLEAWENLCCEHGRPKTPRVRTPRGWHVYYRGSLPPTAGRLADGIDTRGVGSYVLVPPSSVNGVSYAWHDEGDMQDVPAWIAEACVAKTDHITAAVAELDTPAAIARARATLAGYAERGDVAREGFGGDNRTYILCAEIVALGCSAQVALDLIEEIWNPHCIPPWSHDELSVKLDNASRYMQNEAGAFNVATAHEAFGSTLDKLIAEAASDPPSPRSRFTPLRLNELITELKEPAWIIPGLIPELGTVQVLGPQKSFKTFLTLDLALGIASGTKTFDFVPEPRPVVYCVGENASAFALKHIPAWRVAREVDGDFPFYTVPAVPRAVFPDEVKELISEVKKLGIAPGVVVIDTATRALRGLDENSAKDMGMFSECCDFIRAELHCTVIAIRHTGKDVQRGGRGSNVIEGDFDTLLQIDRHEKSMAVALTVKEQRNAAEREEPYTFEARSIGQSLALFPTSAEQFSQLTRTEHVYSRRTVGKALSALDAFGRDKCVLTQVLAAEMLPAIPSETPEARQEALGRACKTLHYLARGPLLAYCEVSGRERLWFLPAAETDNP